jgi:hypothetical protein
MTDCSPDLNLLRMKMMIKLYDRDASQIRELLTLLRERYRSGGGQSPADALRHIDDWEPHEPTPGAPYNHDKIRRLTELIDAIDEQLPSGAR